MNITVDKILDYVFNNPYNTNYLILRQMLEELSGTSGSDEGSNSAVGFAVVGSATVASANEDT